MNASSPHVSQAGRPARSFRASPWFLDPDGSHSLQVGHETVASRSRPRAVAPLDDGTDAVEMAQRLLLASTLLEDLHIFMRFPRGQWTWRGRVSQATCFGNLLQLRAASTTVRVSLASVVAVSYCADRMSSGFSLSDEDGAFLTLWSTDARTFDDWLAALTPEPSADAEGTASQADLDARSETAS